MLTFKIEIFLMGKGATRIAPGVIIIFHAPLQKIMLEDARDIILKANMIDN